MTALPTPESVQSVYTELVAFCQSEGITHQRFEQRLDHWLRLRYGNCHNGNGAGPPANRR